MLSTGRGSLRPHPIGDRPPRAGRLSRGRGAGVSVAAIRGRNGFVYRFRDLARGKVRPATTTGDASKMTIGDLAPPCAVSSRCVARGGPQAIRQRNVVAKVAETAHETCTVRALIVTM
jgi:hypothetical protein